MALSSLADSIAGLSALAPLPVLADSTVVGYVSIFKSILLLGVLLLWTWGLSWADKDAKAAHLPRTELNIANLAGMIVAYAIVFLVPITFWILFPVVLGILAAEVAVYLNMRKKVVGLEDLQQQWKDWKKGVTKAKASDLPGPVGISGKSGPLPVPTSEQPEERVVYDAVQGALTEPLKKGAEQIDLVPSAEGVNVKFLVDLVPYTGATTLDAAQGPNAVAYLKAAAGLDVNEKRKPQSGSIKLTFENKKLEAKVQSAGTTAGEFLRFQFEPKARHNRKSPDLGFTPAQLETVKAEAKNPKGIVLLATPKGHGLTQLLYGVMRGHDAFLQHIQTIEHDPVDDLENVTANKMPAATTPDELAKKIDWMMSQQPDVLMFDKMESPSGAKRLVDFAVDEGKKSYIGMRAGSTAEAIEQWRKVAGDDPRAIDALQLVICGRVLRKLCQGCAEAYTPDANTLKKLNMNPEKVTQLFKARETPVRDDKGKIIPCEFCNDLRYKGRTGVFEVLVVTDELRAAIKQDLSSPGAKLGSNFRTAFRKARGRYLQEEALAMVERGETSVQEVLRVLKPADESAAAAPARRPAAAPARPPAAPGAAPAAPQRAAAPRPPGTPRPPGAPPARPAAGPPRS